MTFNATFNLVGSLVSTLRRFAANGKGAAAVEFAMLLPIMMTMYYGSVELTTGISASRKTTLVAHTVADLVARTTNITNAGIVDIFEAAKRVAAPFAGSTLTVKVSSVVIDANGIAKVAWSDAYGGTARTIGQVITLKPALAVPNTSLIFGEVTYIYTPLFGRVLAGTFDLGDSAMLRPRLSNIVTRSAS